MLSSLLLSRSTGKSHVDNDLDAIFAASAKAAPLTPSKNEVAANITSAHSTSKRKRKEDKEMPTQPTKKHRPNEKVTSTTETSPIQEENNALEPSTKVSKEKTKRKESKKHKGKEVNSVDDLEEIYSKQRIDEPVSKKKSKPKASPPDEVVQNPTHQRASPQAVADLEKAGETDADDDELDTANLIHESISGRTEPTKRKSVYVPPGETKAQRDERTIFIGNLAFGILKSKSLQKALKRHILSFVPGYPQSGAKIESIRFRSVAFKAPTNPQALKEESTTSKPSRKQDRAFSYRIGKDEDASTGGSNPKTYLSPAEKKRIAFIKGEFHDQAASVNAYAVFAYQDPAQARAGTDLETMEPSKIAAAVVELLDGTQFEGRTLRVDHVAAPTNDHGNTAVRDPASTVFVGNLEFTANEEDLRVFFETLLTAEMGPPSDDSKSKEAESEEHQRMPHWVSSVRIIRDKDTQLGKGFGYVRFTEHTCVDEVIAMESTKLKFAKRKLRVTRCKAAGDKTTRRDNDVKPSSQPSPRPERAKAPKAKGDPMLGERIKDLSKEERREAKKQDPSRLARRMEKKKTRITLEKSLKRPEKERMRVRKAATMKTANKKPQSKQRTST